MEDHAAGPSMCQKIFSLNLGVETVSLYLLCCAIADGGAAITQETLTGKWNGTAESLDRELERLETYNILRRVQAEEGSSYRLVDEKQWRPPA